VSTAVPTNTYMSVVIPSAYREQLIELARKHDLSLSAELRRALAAYLAQMKDSEGFVRVA
jgi:hypothetical protein